MLKGGLVLIWELDMNLVPTLVFTDKKIIQYCSNSIILWVTIIPYCSKKYYELSIAGFYTIWIFLVKFFCQKSKFTLFITIDLLLMRIVTINFLDAMIEIFRLLI